jgi:hypothetical protein
MGNGFGDVTAHAFPYRVDHVQATAGDPSSSSDHLNQLGIFINPDFGTVGG